MANKVVIQRVEFEGGTIHSIGRRGYGEDGVITKIRFERDGYNKNRQVDGPVYVVETENGARYIIPAGKLIECGVKLVEEAPEEDNRRLPEAAPMTAPIIDVVPKSTDNITSPVAAPVNTAEENFMADILAAPNEGGGISSPHAPYRVPYKLGDTGEST